jgi:hypothetical protein
MKVSKVERAAPGGDESPPPRRGPGALEKAARHIPPERERPREKVQTLIAEIRRLQIRLAEAPADLVGGVR